ncbi:MAG: hypothetical protein CL678_17290 [Bdellovibrionaceae bacterium]|nr:hypothetical protein [Pseudobdellovibrionaceae bacterium]|tara:strand:- start:258 stop:770 length:513 start_codon:yes stop_codon:yes gene_type:complete
MRVFNFLFLFILLIFVGDQTKAMDWIPRLDSELSYASTYPSTQVPGYGAVFQWKFGVNGKFFQQKGLLLGAHLSGVHTVVGPVSRSMMGLGLEISEWLMNALGLGLTVDSFLWGLNPQSRVRSFQFEPFLAMRVFRFWDEGAIGVKLFFHYDTLYKWGGGTGIRWEWGVR